MKIDSLNAYIPQLIAIFFSIQITYWSITGPDSPLLITRGALIIWAFFTFVYWAFDIHKRFGFFGVREPRSHFWFQIKSVWVVASWALGTYWWAMMVGIKPSQPYSHIKTLDWMYWEMPEWVRVENEPGYSKYVGGVALLYIIDFTRYWAHRIGHWQFFYRTFPFAHAQHHNTVWLNPWTLAYSPFFHLANWAAITPMVIFWSLGLKQATIYGSILLMFPNLNQHLGFDPLPWVTRLNHYYCYGLIPWIPVYHQYHHLPYVKRGNYGNLTAFWDYFYGTLIPECIEHIETGKMPERILEKFKDPKQLEVEFEGKLKNRNRLDYNPTMDSSIFSLRFL